MSHTDYLYLLSEREAVCAMLAETPEEDVIDRYSLEGRLACIEARMQRALHATAGLAQQTPAACLWAQRTR